MSEGIVIRRTVLPSGDVVATLLSSHGKWRGIVRKGKLPGGNAGRLSLFHDVTVQLYRRREDDLALLTQVKLNGALRSLSRPEIYPFAHLLAELVDQLTVDIHGGEKIYTYFASGLRGLNLGTDPLQVSVAYAWNLLQQAGLAPRVAACASCGGSGPFPYFDVRAGGLTCEKCASGIQITPGLASDLQTMVTGSVREALASPLNDAPLHLTTLERFCSYHVAELHSFSAVRQLGPVGV